MAAGAESHYRERDPKMSKVITREIRLERWQKHTQVLQPQSQTKLEMGSQVTVLMQPVRVTLDNFSVSFMEKVYSAMGLVCLRQCDTQLSSTPDMELGIPVSSAPSGPDRRVVHFPAQQR